MNYIISTPQPHNHFIELECIIENNHRDSLTVSLPAWRPGRYELQNFARNIQKWVAYDKEGNVLKSKKETKDSWIIETKGISEIHIKYNYYAYQLDAGACWLDDSQLYVNPIHCFLYVQERMDEECFIKFNLPQDYKIATGLKHASHHELWAANYHELADGPFIASNSLQHNSYDVNGVKFHIWFQGICKPDWSRIIDDFKKFTIDQMEMMESFPAKDYHFLTQVLPYPYYHGVEHLNSTVLAIGPGYKLMDDEIYNELLGVASHELFHAWNVKAIRPIEMMPYEYSKENYSRLGYVCEGVTTYYGDLFLFRSGVFSEREYFKTFNQQLQKHFDNHGRFNLSVADSSFDTWLDGYVEGIPARKTSIYTEGCLIAFMTDIAIRRHTNNEKSLDDVMLYLFENFGKKDRGYSEKDYQTVIETISGASFEKFFAKYVSGTSDFEPLLTEELHYLGLELVKQNSPIYFEDKFGFRVTQSGSAKVSRVLPGSIADKAGLGKDDEIIAINKIKLNNNLREWCEYFKDETIELTVCTQTLIRTVTLTPGQDNYFHKYTIAMMDFASPLQKIAFEAWAKEKFDS